jgi:hypothetical protein
MAVPMELRVYNTLFVFMLFALIGLALGKYQGSSAKYQVSGVKYQMSGVKYQVSSAKHQSSASNIQYPISNIQLLITNYQLLLLLTWFSLILALVLYYNLEFYQAQGRYLFPALGAIAIFMVLGLRAWVKLAASLLARLKIPYALTEWVSLGVFVAGFVALDWMCLYRYVIPNLR